MSETVQVIVEERITADAPKEKNASVNDLHGAESDNALREHITITNFWRHLQIGAVPLTLLPTLAVYGLLTTPLQRNTALLAIAWYALTILSITAGYHRLFSHKAYEGSTILKAALLCLGAGAAEGSCRWWARGHRAHHRYSDTNKDPYGVHRGFLNAHIGWMLFTARYRPGRVDMADLDADPLVRFQHRHYLGMLITFAFMLPISIAGFGWGDWKGGFLFACCLRMTLVHHATFCVNSVAHYFGDAPFDDNRTPRDHIVTAILTHGEGYHNFHHEFPNDYRNAIKWYQYDPTRNFIWVCSQLGFAKNLRRTGDAVVHKSQLQMEQKKLDKRKELVTWPKPDLPNMSSDQFACESKGKLLLLYKGYIHDASLFAEQHPGGKAFVESRRGKDIADSFDGGVYNHSNAARNQLDMLRIARLRDD
jgi:stearoyl-CoA desaturase (delta-9 desaturase)